MKRTLSILLITAFLLNSIGIIFAFFHQKSQIKSEFKSFLKSGIPLSNLEVIKIPKNENSLSGFKRIEDNEFRLNGKMYDIVKEVHTFSQIIFYCVNDEKEERLLEKFSDSIKNLAETKDSFKKNLGKLIKYLFLELIEFQTEKNIPYVSVIGLISLKTDAVSFIPEISSPPPKYQV